MKKLNVAIIGQGRSGKQIHGVNLLNEKNVYFNVAYVVDEDEYRREKAKEDYAGCKVFADYRYYPNQMIFNKVLRALDEYKEALCN